MRTNPSTSVTLASPGSGLQSAQRFRFSTIAPPGEKRSRCASNLSWKITSPAPTRNRPWSPASSWPPTGQSKHRVRRENVCPRKQFGLSATSARNSPLPSLRRVWAFGSLLSVPFERTSGQTGSNFFFPVAHPSRLAERRAALCGAFDEPHPDEDDHPERRCRRCTTRAGFAE